MLVARFWAAKVNPRDGQKYYESFVLANLRDRALRTGIHPVLVKVTYNYWRGPRIVRIGQHHSPRIFYAACGLPAGDISNDAFVKAYAIFAFDAFVSRNPNVRLSSYVGDDVVNSVGDADAVRKDLKAAAKDLREVFRDELEVDLAIKKLATVASTAHLAAHLHTDLGS